MKDYALGDEYGGRDPLFREIADTISAGIAEGIYAEGQKLPSTSELARRYSVDIATAARGLQLLERHGVLNVRRGVGFYVADNAQELVRHERRRVFDQRFVAPLAREASRLGTPWDELLTSIRQAMDEAAGDQVEG